MVPHLRVPKVSVPVLTCYPSTPGTEVVKWVEWISTFGADNAKQRLCLQKRIKEHRDFTLHIEASPRKGYSVVQHTELGAYLDYGNKCKNAFQWFTCRMHSFLRVWSPSEPYVPVTEDPPPPKTLGPISMWREIICMETVFFPKITIMFNFVNISLNYVLILTTHPQPPFYNCNMNQPTENYFSNVFILEMVALVRSGGIMSSVSCSAPVVKRFPDSRFCTGTVMSLLPAWVALLWNLQISS